MYEAFGNHLHLKYDMHQNRHGYRRQDNCLSKGNTRSYQLICMQKIQHLDDLHIYFYSLECFLEQCFFPPIHQRSVHHEQIHTFHL